MNLQVELGDRSYPIYIASNLANSLAETIKSLVVENRPFALIVDANVAEQHGEYLNTIFAETPRYVVPSGEGSKCFEQLGHICSFLAENRIDRSGAIFAVGGGVTGDLAGFAAAAFLRGIDFYQVPTTLLSMVDSSVGGKTGINIPEGKNLVGAFWQPKAVFADMDLLKTLPEREFAAGMAEVIKYGLLYDAEFLDVLENYGSLNPEHSELPSVVCRCCEIKAEIVRADERESAASGGRALLNLGHTFGHAIEAVAGYGDYLHGEAIAIGLYLAARLSEELALIDRGSAARVRKIVEQYKLPYRLRSPLSASKLLAAMSRDKKVKQGRLRFVLMEELGKAITYDEINPTRIHKLWSEVGAEV